MKLYASLPSSIIEVLKKLIFNAIQLGTTTPQNLLLDLQKNEMESPYFAPIKNFFNTIFGSYNQTTLFNNDLIIGYGLDLTANPEGIALFYAIDPTKDWENLLNKVGEPSPPLTQQQLDKLFYLTLIGASNSDKTFNGYLAALNTTLAQFSDSEFPANQLISITGLINACNGVLPSTITKAVADMFSNDSDIEPMQIIIDYANTNFNISKQNQLLQIGAMFHGNLNASDLDVYLTQQQKGRLLLNNQDIVINITDGPVKRGVPIGNYQENDFEGFTNITMIPNLNPQPYTTDETLFGTPNSDNLKILSPYSANFGTTAVIYGGDKADLLMVNCGSGGIPGNPVLIYLSGNKGEDTYAVTNIINYYGIVTIYDSDHSGKIFTFDSIDGQIYNYRPFAGPIIDNNLNFGPQTYRVITKIEEDGSTTLTFTYMASLEILSYKKGQFNLLPDCYSFPIQNSDPSLAVGAVTPKGLIGLLPFAGNNIHFYNADGSSYKSIQVLPNKSFWGNVMLKGATDNTFHIIGSVSHQGCTLLYIKVDPINNQVTTQIIDQTKDNCGLAFPQFMLTPTDGSGMDMAWVYAKNDSPENYGLYVGMHNYTSRIDNLQNTTINGFYRLNSIYAGPINEGFLVSSLNSAEPFITYTSTIYQFSNSAKLISNETSNNINIIGTAALSKGYAIVYSNFTGDYYSDIYAQVFYNGEWSSPYLMQGFSDCVADKFNGPFLQTLLGDNVLVMDVFSGNFIFDKNNTLLMGPFHFERQGITPDINSLQGSALMPNGDVLVAYTPSYQIGVTRKGVTLTTSYLELGLQESHQKRTVTYQNTKPLKTTDILNQTHQQTNSSSPILGVKDDPIQIQGDLSHSLIDRTAASALSAAQHGCISGISNVARYASHSIGCSELTSWTFRELLYYGGVFCWRLNFYL